MRTTISTSALPVLALALALLLAAPGTGHCVPLDPEDGSPTNTKNCGLEPSGDDPILTKPEAEPARPAAGKSAGKRQKRTIVRAVPNRYVFAFLAWIDEPYIAYRTIPDPYTGRVHRVPVVRYNRVMVRIYYDRVTNSYGYFDRFGNPVPYLPNRYQYRFTPF